MNPWLGRLGNNFHAGIDIKYFKFKSFFFKHFFPSLLLICFALDDGRCNLSQLNSVTSIFDARPTIYSPLYVGKVIKTF